MSVNKDMENKKMKKKTYEQIKSQREWEEMLCEKTTDEIMETLEL